jgi:hypothetical protein
MYAPLSQASRLLCATILALVLLAAPAYADAPFTPRFAQTLKGDIAAVGNTLMTCPASAACTTAQNATASGNALNNNNYVMGYVDVDADATTFDSSSATVSLPAGSTVLWAGLYWAADTTPGTSGVAAPTPASRGTVRLKAGAGAYQTVTAAPADVLASVSQANRYRGFADVTTAVAAAGSGTYTVANVQAGTGNDRFAGWALLIAYRDTTQAVRGLHVYDGLGTVDATHTFQTTVAPFHTPVSPAPVTTKVGLLSFEGDAGLANETATFNAVALTDALNPANNAMNSTIESAGTAFTAKSPNYANQLGMDLDVFPNLGALTNNQTSASLYFSSTNEYYMPSAFFLVSDEGPATVSVPPSVTPPGGGGPAQDGQTLSANPGSWNATGTPTYTYQWQRCDAAGNSCQDIPGATNSTYTPTAADVGGTVRVVVTATNAAGATSSVSAPIAIAAAPPVNTAPPALPGPATQGQPLQADAGNWTGTGPVTHTYQWQRCDAAGNNCQDVAGATGSSYTPGAEDVGGTVRVVVTSTNSVGSSVSASAPVAVAPPVPPVSIAPPVLWGPVAQGQPLTVDPGAWAGGGTSYSYAWQRCDADGNGCADIPGATDATYTPGADDVGHVLRAVVTATNDAGSTTTTTAPSPAVVAASDPAAEDLAGIAGGLIGQASCQQLVGGAKYRRVALTGIGTVRVRAYTSGPALRSSPVRLTTEISGGRARGVRYLLDGRAVGAATGSRHAATLTPSQLGNVGVHTLRTAVRGRRGAVRTVVLTLRTEPCQVLFTAQRWRTTAGAGLRLRVDSRTALSQLSFAVPSVLLPRQGAQPRVAGFIRLYVGGRTRPLRYNLSLRRRGATPTLLSGPGRPTVSLRRGGLRVTGLPARAAVAEVTLYRVTKLDRATPQRAYTLRASVARAAGMPETFSAKPRAQR